MSQRQILEGLLILKDYAGDDEVAAEHDQIWFGTTEKPDEMNDEDVKKLKELGFYWDDEFECWSYLT